jgi:hypothetical protein
MSSGCIYLAKDDGELYQTHVKDFFQHINQMEEHYEGRLLFSQEADMCSLQKTVNTGGAMKVKNYACYCCNIHRSKLATPNQAHCADCVWLIGHLQEPCYHQVISDENSMAW